MTKRKDFDSTIRGLEDQIRSPIDMEILEIEEKLRMGDLEASERSLVLDPNDANYANGIVQCTYQDWKTLDMLTKKHKMAYSAIPLVGTPQIIRDRSKMNRLVGEEVDRTLTKYAMLVGLLTPIVQPYFTSLGFKSTQHAEEQFKNGIYRSLDFEKGKTLDSLARECDQSVRDLLSDRKPLDWKLYETKLSLVKEIYGKVD